MGLKIRSPDACLVPKPSADELSSGGQGPDQLRSNVHDSHLAAKTSFSGMTTAQAQHSPLSTGVLAVGHSHLSQVIKHCPLQSSLLAFITEAAEVSVCGRESRLKSEAEGGVQTLGPPQGPGITSSSWPRHLLRKQRNKSCRPTSPQHGSQVGMSWLFPASFLVNG
jgi:hypothetical protein